MFEGDGEECGFRPVVSGIILELRKSEKANKNHLFFFKNKNELFP
jgi:hypothetical protein